MGLTTGVQPTLGLSLRYRGSPDFSPTNQRGFPTWIGSRDEVSQYARHVVGIAVRPC